MLQLQKDGDWESRVDAAFAKLDSNGDGYIDLEELLAQLPFEAQESYDGERLMEVGCCINEAVVSISQAAVRPVWMLGGATMRDRARTLQGTSLELHLTRMTFQPKYWHRVIHMTWGGKPKKILSL